MTAWQAIRRATLLIPSGPLHDPSRHHLHIVLNDPAPDGLGQDRVLIVSVTSIPLSQVYDSSCTLFPGEHPFVAKHSYMLYRKAMLADPAALEAKVQNHQYIAKPLLDEKVFSHIITGLLESPYTEPAVLAYFKASNGI